MNANGRRLAEARSQEQFDAISRFARQQIEFWLGGNDITLEGEWQWTSDNSPINLSRFFNRGEPNGGTRENCLSFYTAGMIDQACNVGRPFLCESGAIGNAPVCSD